MKGRQPERRTRWDVIDSARTSSWSGVGRMCVMAICLSSCAAGSVLAVVHLAMSVI